MLFAREALAVLIAEPFFDRLPVPDELRRRTLHLGKHLEVDKCHMPKLMYEGRFEADLSAASNKLTTCDIPLIRILTAN